MPKGQRRPKRDDPERQDKILAAVRVGATYELAAAYAGMSYDTFCRLRDGNAIFAGQLREAEGAAAMSLLGEINRQGRPTRVPALDKDGRPILDAEGRPTLVTTSEGDWRALAWILERRHPQQYGKQVTELQGNIQAPLTIIIEERSDGPQ